jgi:dTDP-glucose 4,6-dehydratase
MRYLVTGGRGFIGSYVCNEIISNGDEVVIMSNLSHPSKNTDGWDYIYGDIRYQYDCDCAVINVDCVIHLAAKINVDRSREDCRPFFDTNILGTYNILESCRKFKKKMIQASTSEAIGNMKEEYLKFGMDESHPYSPDNPYGATKAAADMLCIGWFKSYDVDVTILRSFNVSGIGQSYDKEGAFIPRVIEQAYNNQNPVIFGDGNQTRDYLWVGDLARAYYLLSKKDYAGEVFHAGTGREISIKNIADYIINISGKNLKVDYVQGRIKEIKRLKCNYSKMSALGWRPTKSIEEILTEMWRDRVGTSYKNKKSR